MLLIDELAAHRRDDVNKGLGWTAATTAEAITEMCKPWGIKARVADDACFSNTGHASTIAQEFARKGVYFDPAKKADRITGWNLMRRLMADAGKPDVPGLYVSRDCSYFWDTVPTWRAIKSASRMWTAPGQTMVLTPAGTASCACAESRPSRRSGFEQRTPQGG